jgi:hypothetical protein
MCISFAGNGALLKCRATIMQYASHGWRCNRQKALKRPSNVVKGMDQHAASPAAAETCADIAVVFHPWAVVAGRLNKWHAAHIRLMRHPETIQHRYTAAMRC